jgi:hypothetical protein
MTYFDLNFSLKIPVSLLKIFLKDLKLNGFLCVSLSLFLALSHTHTHTHTHTRDREQEEHLKVIDIFMARSVVMVLRVYT